MSRPNPLPTGYMYGIFTYLRCYGLFGGWKKYNFCWAKDSSASVPLISFVPTKARLTQMLCEIPASHNHQQTNQGAGGLLNQPLEKSAPVKLDHLKGIEIQKKKCFKPPPRKTSESYPHWCSNEKLHEIYRQDG